MADFVTQQSKHCKKNDLLKLNRHAFIIWLRVWQRLLVLSNTTTTTTTKWNKTTDRETEKNRCKICLNHLWRWSLSGFFVSIECFAVGHFMFGLKIYSQNGPHKLMDSTNLFIVQMNILSRSLQKFVEILVSSLLLAIFIIR